MKVECDGGPFCLAPRHLHGCFADSGDCDHPSEHRARAAGRAIRIVRIWLEGEDRFVSVEVDGTIVHLREGDEV